VRAKTLFKPIAAEILGHDWARSVIERLSQPCRSPHRADVDVHANNLEHSYFPSSSRISGERPHSMSSTGTGSPSYGWPQVGLSGFSVFQYSQRALFEGSCPGK
jgi:hypothetical protein